MRWEMTNTSCELSANSPMKPKCCLILPLEPWNLRNWEVQESSDSSRESADNTPERGNVSQDGISAFIDHEQEV